MARPRVYVSNADKQQAYRERRRQAGSLGSDRGPKGNPSEATVLHAPLVIEDTAGRKVLTVEVGAHGPCLRLFDGAGRLAVLLLAHEGGKVGLYGPGGMPQALLAGEAAGGTLWLFHPDGTPKAQA